MTLERKRTCALALAALLTACNSTLRDDPRGLRCDPQRSPPCANGFVCIDDICVHPAELAEGGLPPQNSGALHPATSNTSSGDGVQSDQVSGRSDGIARPTPTRNPTLPGDAAFGTSQGETSVPDLDAGDAQASSAGDLTSSESAATTAVTVVPSGETTSGSPPGNPTSAPEALSSADDATEGPECSVTCVAPEHGTAVCQGAVCDIQCETGWTECDGRCVDTSVDVQNCGVCSRVCQSVSAGAAVCQGGVCAITCDPGFEWCGSACVDTATSATNCGACEVVCDAGEVCGNGECSLDCPAGTLECSDSCVETDSNPAHCGACDVACTAPTNATAACVAGQCDFVCRDGFDECSGACVDTENDVDNCGGCGTKCEGNGARCDDGECESPCGKGKTECDGECVDLEKDEYNCGECGNYCLLGSCRDGDCTLLGI